MLDVCCDLTSYETSRWLELKPDRDNVTRSRQRHTEYVAVVKARNECRHTANMSSHGDLCHDGLLRGSYSRQVSPCVGTLWSFNKLARSVKKWTQACDRRLARSISHICFTSDYRQHCHVGNAAQHCRFGAFQDSQFARDLEDSKSTSGGVLCFFEVEHLYPSVGCARSKRQCLTGLENQRSCRWMLVCVWTVYMRLTCGNWSLKCWERPREYPNQPKHKHGKLVFRPKSHPRLKQVLGQNVDLSNMDQVPSNALLSDKESQLYIFEAKL